MDLTERIKERAHEIGFDKIGITDASPMSECIERYYHEWLEKGYHADMVNLERSRKKRLAPGTVLKGVKSIISAAIGYNPGEIHFPADRSNARISRYALGRDYHDIVSEKLGKLLDFIRGETKGMVHGKPYCDTGPVMEKVLAERAGLGWIGKHGVLVTREFGSWVFLGEIFLDINLEIDTPAENLCSTCTFCVHSCPTKAIIEPGVLDASRCISYQTIENRAVIPPGLRNALGNWVFGCDCCQEACPYNSNVAIASEKVFLPQPEMVSARLDMLFAVTAEKFGETFRDSSIARAQQSGFLRNIIVAMGNSGNTTFIPLLDKAQKKADAVLREHAAWAIAKITETE